MDPQVWPFSRLKTSPGAFQPASRECQQADEGQPPSGEGGGCTLHGFVSYICTHCLFSALEF